ncbi:MAG: Cof-type HAD-IIB family hydrolase [Mobilitalea sp.]
MDNKIIFFDIDGTILSHRDNSISDSTISAIKQAQANGHLTFINTGRTLAELEDRITEIGFDGYVCGCGTYILHNDSVLLQQTIDAATLPTLIDDLHKYEMEAILEGTSAIYYDKISTMPYIKMIKEKQIFGRKTNIQTWDGPDISIDKFCMWSQHDDNFQKFYQKYENEFEFIDRGEDFYEVVPKGYSKASGIEFLINHFDIPHDNTYALGDSSNDLSMLTYVKNSIGMGNSDEVILDVVSYVTEDVDKDGVELALRHYGII